MRRARPIRAATATRTGPLTCATGSSVCGSASARYSGSTPRRRSSSRPAAAASAPSRSPAPIAAATACSAAGSPRPACAPPPARGGRCGSTARGRRPRERSGRRRSATGGSGRATRRRDDDRLLGVLLAEVGHVGPDAGESSFVTTVATPVEVLGPALRPPRGMLVHAAHRSRSWRSRPGTSRPRWGRTADVHARPRAARPTSQLTRRADRPRGQRGSLNCVGLTNTETTTDVALRARPSG